MSEVVLICLISMLIAIGLTEVFTPLLNSAFGLDFELNWMQPEVLIALSVLFLITILLSGFYPSLLMSQFNPLSIIRNTLKLSRKISIRKGLVIVQFVISIFMIVSTMLVSYQYFYLNSFDMGFKKDAIVLVDLNNSEIRNKLSTFKAELENYPEVRKTSGMSGEPGGFHDASTVSIEGLEDQFKVRTLFTDENYLELFGIEMIGGRNFIANDTINTGVILNKKALDQIGLSFEEVQGRNLHMPIWEIDRTIVGVVENYNFQSLHNGIEPLIIVQGGRPRKMAVSISGNDIQSFLGEIEKTWTGIVPENPISYTFLDDKLLQLYEDERKQSMVFSTFSLVSILLACLGVTGLAFYSAQQRKKEFGVRRVLGASAGNLIGLISREYLLLIVIASLVALPGIIFFVSDWLDNFAYQINLSAYWPVFLMGGLGTAGLAWMTVSLISLKIVQSNPVDSLRSE